MDSRERDRLGHPPACTCVICDKKRLAGVSRDSRVKGCPVCDGSPKFRFHHGQYRDMYVDDDGKIWGPIYKVVLGKHGRFSCIGCYGVVRKNEIDDPVLKSVEDTVHQYWENREKLGLMSIEYNETAGLIISRRLVQMEQKEKADNASGIEGEKVQEAEVKQGQVNQASRDRTLDEWTRKYHTKVSFWQKLKSLLYEGPSH
jgi:hypothetical protein